MPTDPTKTNLIEAEKIAGQLFKAIETRGLIVPGKSEKELNEEIFELAEELFGIKKFWHKRIVRAGTNTLKPYDENPPDLIIGEDDIIFFDFGPIIEEWEADFGRTYILGNDPFKHKLKNDIEIAWHEGYNWFHKHTRLTCSEYYWYIDGLAKKQGYTIGNYLAGHLIGYFPHERLNPGEYGLWVHPENHLDMFSPDSKGNKRHWILELHFVDKEKQIGAFFEQLLI